MHRGNDGYLQQQKTRLVKPKSSSTWSNLSASNATVIKSIDRSIAKFVPRVRSVLSGKKFQEEQYDSDEDPQSLVGKRVKIKWAKEKWYLGVVDHYNPAKMEHFIVYDDGDKRSYNMSDKIFALL